MFLPAYWFRAGLGSKVSTWLTPPNMNSQITRLAFGWNGRFAFALKHGSKHQPRQAHPGISQKHSAAGGAATGRERNRFQRLLIRLHGIPHRMVTKSVWFSNT